VLSKADAPKDVLGGSALLGVGALGVQRGLLSQAELGAQIDAALPLVEAEKTAQGIPVGDLLRRLRPATPPEAALTGPEIQAFGKATQDVLEKALDRYAALTGVRLHVLLEEYRRAPLMGRVLIETVRQHPALDADKTAELDALKEQIAALITVRAPLIPANFEAFRTANVRARWEILRQQMYQDLLAATRGHSDGYRDAEELLYAAVGRHELWLEKSRLEQFLAEKRPLYGEGAPTPPAAGLVGEVKSARERVTAIVAEVTLAVTELVLIDDEASLPRTSLPPTDFGPWASKAFCDAHCRPRWAYYTGGQRQDRAVWLEQHLRANMSPAEKAQLNPCRAAAPEENPPSPWPYVAEDGELVLLVERSHPDREVRPPPELSARCVRCAEAPNGRGGAR
jgi:hypothetical protein